MALQNTKTLPNGESGNYWKITSYQINKQTMTITYSVSLFKDQTFSGIAPIKGIQKTFTFPCTKEQLAGDLIALGYTNILTKANKQIKAAQPAKAAVAASPAVPATKTTPFKAEVEAKAAVPAQPAQYGDNDLHGATSV